MTLNKCYKFVIFKNGHKILRLESEFSSLDVKTKRITSYIEVIDANKT